MSEEKNTPEEQSAIDNEPRSLAKNNEHDSHEQIKEQPQQQIRNRKFLNQK